MNKTAKLWLVFVLLLVFLAPSTARADVVADWNAIALQTALQTAIPPVRPGPSAILDLAMVHAAMHDAIQAFEGRFESYGAPIPNASGLPVAAAARAAHDLLVARFPNQSGTLDKLLDDYLNGLVLQGDAGLVIGQQAAANILNLRAGDGSFPSKPEIFVGGDGPGEWRPTQPGLAPMAAPWLGAVTPFILKDPTQFRASPPPPSLDSGKYVHDYDEVKAFQPRREFLLCSSCMTETDQCGVETRKDGTKICSLHKQPLEETTELGLKPEGKDYPQGGSSWECPVSGKVITTPGL